MNNLVKIDMAKLELSGTTYDAFQDIFQTAYEAFSKDTTQLIVRNYEPEKFKGESGGLNGYGYFHLRRALANLNLHDFVKVYKRKPPKPAPQIKFKIKRQGDKYGYSHICDTKEEAEDYLKNLKSTQTFEMVPFIERERAYSYLEVHPTTKGFMAYKKGDFCPVQPTTIYVSEGKHIQTADKIGIGKGYVGAHHLYEKYFEPTKERLRVAWTRWGKDWSPAFDQLFRTTLATMKEEETKTEIQKLIDKLIPTLPKRRNLSVAVIQRELEKSAKLEAFVTA